MKILKAIIQTYMETGEPVGSRTISKYTDLNLSSATIRNEMADLEEMGLIIQPYTSAGRIPSDKGYRLYVDNLMEEKEKEVSEMKSFLIQRVDRVELLLKQMAKLLAVNTNYATMISAPRYRGNKLKFIQLSKLEEGKLLAVVVVEGNIIKNTMLDVEGNISDDDLLQLNILLNSTLNGLTIDEINLGLITKLKEKAGDHSGVVGSVLEAVADAIKVDEEQPQIYTSGATNIFKYPELSDGQRASNLISAFEDKQELMELVNDVSDEEQGIQVYIGNETPVESMKDCSVVTANYELGDGMRGTIGIIGPKRMDYEHVVGTLRTLMEQLDIIYHKKE
ncbi:MAG TPA: heat-inducible transcription repressor HrcA [Candidatus Fimimorpha excrementavium]|nr:heat-inducible transcription repressor HrcA [Candidatus Fimimorpha excrementavium]